MLTDLPRLLSQINPGIRVPIEVLGGRTLYNNQPFASSPQPVAAGPLSGPVAALANALGLAQKNAQGQTVVDPRFNYGLKSFLPPVAQMERLSPTTALGNEKQTNALLAYLGIPVTHVTPGMKQAEINRRKKDVQNYQRQQKALGFAP